MLKLAVLVSLVALCAAQTPPARPKIPETFVSQVEREHVSQGVGIVIRVVAFLSCMQGEVEFHREGRTLMGKGEDVYL